MIDLTVLLIVILCHTYGSTIFGGKATADESFKSELTSLYNHKSIGEEPSALALGKRSLNSAGKSHHMFSQLSQIYYINSNLRVFFNYVLLFPHVIR